MQLANEQVIGEITAMQFSNGWSATYEYPGFLAFTQKDNPISVIVGTDGPGNGVLDEVIVQIQHETGIGIDDGCVINMAIEKRTAKRVAAIVQTWLDDYDATTPIRVTTW